MVIFGDVSKARFNALIIDNIIAFVVTILIVALVPEKFPTVKGIFLVLIYLSYFFILEALWSRTLGKYFVGLIVRKLDGSRCGWKAALIRSLLRIIEVNPLLFGALPAGIFVIKTRLKQRLGDILAGTVVISDKTQWE